MILLILRWRLRGPFRLPKPARFADGAGSDEV
jgi:hypothetical protein